MKQKTTYTIKSILVMLLLFCKVYSYSNSVDSFNCDFELLNENKYPINWTPLRSPNSSSSSTTRFYCGLRSVRIDDNNPNKDVGILSQRIGDIQEGKYYTASVMCYLETGSVSLHLQFRDQSNSIIESQITTLSEIGSWKKISITDIAPQNTKFLTLLFYSNSNNVGVSYFDCASISELLNGRFEYTLNDEIKFWNKIHADNFITLNKQPQNSFASNNSIMINDTSPTLSSGLRSSRYYNISTYDMYCAEVICKGSLNKGRIYIEFWDKNNKRISEVHKDIKITSNWQKLAVSANPPNNSVYLTILIYSSKLNEGTLFFDNVNVNIVKNYGFEEVDTKTSIPTNWTITTHNQAAISINAENSYNSYQSIKIDDVFKNKGAGIRSSKIVNITPSIYYSATVKAEGDPVFLYLEFWDKNGSRIKTFRNQSSSSGKYETIKVGGEAPINASFATILMYSPVNNVGVSCIDHVCLGEEIINIGKRKQLFIDDYIIDSTSNVIRKFNKGKKVYPKQKKEALITNSLPWESKGGVSLYGNVIYKNGIYKMWYYSNGRICYATSDDGINWIKPIVSDVSYSNYDSTNIINFTDDTDDLIHEIASIVWDDSYQEYFMYTFVQSDDKAVREYRMYRSNDGINWVKLQTHKSYSKDYHWLDVCTMAPDPYNEQYVLSYKKHIPNQGRLFYQTSISDVLNSDFKEDYCMYSLSDEIDNNLSKTYYKNMQTPISNSYGMGLFPYQGIYIGFNWMYYIDSGDGPIWPELVYSRDLKKQWQRPYRKPIIELGKKGEFDSGMIFTASYPIIVGDTIKLYYGGWNGTHGEKGRTVKIGLVEWRLDGFASLENNSRNMGIVTTKKFISNGTYFTINADASEENAEILIEVYDEFDELIRQFDPIHINDSEHIVTYNLKSNQSLLRGKTVYLKIKMNNAKIYAFQFKDELN